MFFFFFFFLSKNRRLVTVVQTYFITFKTEETNGKYNFSLDIKLYNNKEGLNVFKILI